MQTLLCAQPEATQTPCQRKPSCLQLHRMFCVMSYPGIPLFKRKPSCLQLHRTFSQNPFSSGNPHAYSFIERFVISILRSRKLFASFQAEPGERDDMAKSHPPPTPHPPPNPHPRKQAEMRHTLLPNAHSAFGLAESFLCCVEKA